MLGEIDRDLYWNHKDHKDRKGRGSAGTHYLCTPVTFAVFEVFVVGSSCPALTAWCIAWGHGIHAYEKARGKHIDMHFR
jgi:hypothetical protein